MAALKYNRKGDYLNMGIAINLIGIRDLDGKFQDMLDIKHLCEKNSIPYPNEVESYFKGLAYENECYLKQNLETVEVSKKEFRSDNGEGFEIDVKDIPSEVKTLRFYISC